jgi:hypothetical protein
MHMHCNHRSVGIMALATSVIQASFRTGSNWESGIMALPLLPQTSPLQVEAGEAHIRTGYKKKYLIHYQN